MRTDVLIAGAGPVGLAMASELARFGLSVRIVDLSAHRTDKSKALVVWSRTLELMDRMGCTPAFLDAGFKVEGADIVAGSEQIGHITLTGVASPYPFALMIPQSETERLLEDQLTTFGVSVERSVELHSFTQTADVVTYTLRKADGSEETAEAAWLIGCDGAHSTVRHQLGLQFEGDTQPSDWILGDVHLSGVKDPGIISIAWHAEGLLAIFPITESRYRVIADAGPTDSGAPRPDPTLADIQAVLDKRGPGGITASDPIWLAAFHINERKVKQYRVGRAFLAGDAAHIHSPAGGQGMNTGIQDACNLAWKLALVTRNLCADEPLLDSYSIERNAVGDVVLKGASLATAIGILHGEVRQSLRNHLAHLMFGLAPVRRKAADMLTELAIGYEKSPLNANHSPIHDGPHAGERAPIRRDETPVGSGDTPLFALFADSDSQTAELLGNFRTMLEPATRPPFVEGGMWLVRPDGYVAIATRKGDIHSVARFLESLAPKVTTYSG
jgi:2-polyprenyl-6-methoxyphenol hydroxylase-like FAD-dependent oxidoreductase